MQFTTEYFNGFFDACEREGIKDEGQICQLVKSALIKEILSDPAVLEGFTSTLQKQGNVTYTTDELYDAFSKVAMQKNAEFDIGEMLKNPIVLALLGALGGGAMDGGKGALAGGGIGLLLHWLMKKYNETSPVGNTGVATTPIKTPEQQRAEDTREAYYEQNAKSVGIDPKTLKPEYFEHPQIDTPSDFLKPVAPRRSALAVDTANKANFDNVYLPNGVNMGDVNRAVYPGFETNEQWNESQKAVKARIQKIFPDEPSTIPAGFPKPKTSIGPVTPPADNNVKPLDSAKPDPLNILKQ